MMTEVIENSVEENAELCAKRLRSEGWRPSMCRPWFDEDGGYHVQYGTIHKFIGEEIVDSTSVARTTYSENKQEDGCATPDWIDGRWTWSSEHHGYTDHELFTAMGIVNRKDMDKVLNIFVG